MSLLARNPLDNHTTTSPFSNGATGPRAVLTRSLRSPDLRLSKTLKLAPSDRRPRAKHPEHHRDVPPPSPTCCSRSASRPRTDSHFPHLLPHTHDFPYFATDHRTTDRSLRPVFFTFSSIVRAKQLRTRIIRTDNFPPRPQYSTLPSPSSRKPHTHRTLTQSRSHFPSLPPSPFPQNPQRTRAQARGDRSPPLPRPPVSISSKLHSEPGNPSSPPWSGAFRTLGLRTL
ncbi:hypothetical protein CALVIDRAFT_82663 [Calocera viscosa TUFC12733]|uniref:Uncharacterized protein n=1 Tax=Calocera viscosa (strain TUFC12733) TaxID=1330018 RepID=A0A167N2H5_CALVF|nr:hypothetical protein CALVIDRAFT_82663 [Calocera viscosa TUFC12733]